MLFTNPEFAFLYLPVVLAGFFVLARLSAIWAAAWLFLASVFFYGYWMPKFTALLLASICWNYWVGSQIAKLNPLHAIPETRTIAKRWLLLGVFANLALLAYFKYANFFIDNLNVALGQDWDVGRIILPIGISFFTFTQIAFLADAYQKGTREYGFIHYGLFVTYFPHLIAGPVLHHAQMMPQFRESTTYKVNWPQLAGGLCIFSMGLFKKIVLADGISPYADAVFNAAETGATPDFTEAWVGTLAYTFQLYFDFSGYSDMAVGLSWMFNVKLPYNFNSPYKALNITDFWRRWHMTLSAFLRDYLYIPLGGNRNGAIQRYINLFITMLLGGLWHGANWNFVFWGALHGLYLTINHGFQTFTHNLSAALLRNPLFHIFSWAITFFSVVFAWIFFRANDFPTALRIVGAMNGPPLGSVSSIHPTLWNQGLDLERGLWWLSTLSIIALCFPNSNTIGERTLSFARRHTLAAPLLLGCSIYFGIFLILINSTRDTTSAFIYFNF